jgi:peptidoglycan/LPS O-acetylase OafA/YrhL
MLFHFYAQSISPAHEGLASTIPAWVGWLISHMDCGVEVFFALSGFVIALSMDGQRHDLRYGGNFILRRSLRLDPTYWAAMAIVVAYWMIRWPHWHAFYVMWGGARGILANMFYVQNLQFIYPAKSILEVSWTLCLEVQFYLAYLLILMVAFYASAIAGRHRQRVRSGIVLAAASLIGLTSLATFLHQHRVDFIGRAWVFYLGVGVYAALARRVPPALVALPLLALGGWFVWKGDVEGCVAVGAGGAIYAVGYAGWLGSALAYRPLLYLGRISYSLYLMHMAIGIYALWYFWELSNKGAAGAWLSFLGAIGVSLIISEALHRLVEAPSNRLSQRLKPRRPVPSPAKAQEQPLSAHPPA